MAVWRIVDPPVSVGLDLELEPGAARHLHLGRQPQQAVRLEAPRRARSRACRRPATPTGSRRPRRRPGPPTSRSSSAAQPPERVAVVPAGVAADRAGSARTPRPAGAGTRDAARVDEPRALAHAAVAGRLRRERGVRPAGLARTRGPRSRARGRSRRPTPRGRTEKTSSARGSRDDRLVAQALDELAADARVDRRDEAEPEAREAGRQHRHRDHRAGAGPRCGGVLAHQVAVRDAVGAADLERRSPPSGSRSERRERGRRARPRSRSAGCASAPSAA